jgi:hypothetical protein
MWGVAIEMAPSETIIHTSVPGKPIAEIVFHGGDWSSDKDIRQAIKNAVQTHDPAAVLINLSDFRYHSSDSAAGFLFAFFDEEERTVRPACFLNADREMRPVFNTIDPTGMFGIRYFEDHGEALRYLESRLEPAG